MNRITNLIIDGQNLEFRRFCTTRGKTRVNSKGERIESIENFVNSVGILVEEYNPENIYVAWDKKITRGVVNFRQEAMDGGYKADRPKLLDIENMFAQEALLREVLEAFGVINLFPNTLEADDIIAWLTHTLYGRNLVVSSDQDMYQLVSDNTDVLDKQKLITKDSFEDIVGVPVDCYVIYKAIKGDASDKIPGLPGFGKVRAARLARNWSKENVSEEYRSIVERNIRLMDLTLGYKLQAGEVESYQDQLEAANPVKDKMRVLKLCDAHELEKIESNMRRWAKYFNSHTLTSLISSLNINE